MNSNKKAGRPVGSEVRQNIVDILYYKGPSYAYEVYKIYIKIFPKVTMRNIYYHLKKGVALEEFKIEEIKKEKGNYSWGSIAEKIYYSLGKNSKPTQNKRVEKIISQKNS